jgi:hypothetical protein
MRDLFFYLCVIIGGFSGVLASPFTPSTLFAAWNRQSVVGPELPSSICHGQVMPAQNQQLLVLKDGEQTPVWMLKPEQSMWTKLDGTSFPPTTT